MPKPKSFRIKAGQSAINHIKQNGLSPHDIRVIPAAAGGPKWIILHALDKYLTQKWFTDPNRELHLVGASAGAWRMMCYAVDDPTTALDRFLQSYVEQSYPTWPTGQEVSDKMEQIIRYSLGDDGIDQILSSSAKSLHIITSETNFKQKEGSVYKTQFAQIALKNMLSRSLLNSHLKRVVFTNDIKTKDLFVPDEISSRFELLDQNSIIKALKATGSIPMLMNPVTDIAAEGKMLWDGALVDYHIGLQYHSTGLIFYPHFANRIIPGWFDKFVPWRKATRAVTDKMIMIYPSPNFVASLPDQKIPDRKDFETHFDQNQKRVANWYEVAKRGEEIAEEFDGLWRSGRLIEVIDSF